MVEYEYEGLFANHRCADLLIVERGASLTWNSSTNEFDVDDSSFVIRNADIDNESFRLDERLCSNEDLKFGKCEAAHFEITLYNRLTIPNLKGKIADILIYFNEDKDTIFPVGRYVIDEDKYTAGRQQRQISGYDWNYSLNSLDITAWYDNYFNTVAEGSIYRQIIYVIVDLFKWIQGVSPYDNDSTSPKLPIELDSNYTLTNGAFAINKTIESDTVTFGFFMQGLLEFNGCFGHLNRIGKFQIIMMVGLDGGFVRTITDQHRIPATDYDDENTLGIGQIDVYDRNNSKKFTVQNTNLSEPNIYVMEDPWIIADRDAGDSYTLEALNRMLMVVNHFNYNPSETECTGDLCVEVGDRVKVSFDQPAEWDSRSWFRTYVLERQFRGLQGMFDVYTARGHKRQPKYQITNDRWHTGDSSTGTTGSGTGNVAEVIDDISLQVIEMMRNYGLRVLDEPKVTLEYNKSSQQVEIKWEDPDDLERYRPVPLDWAGTIVVRKEGEKPLNRWNGNADGNTLVDSTTRDEYKTTAFVDNTIEQNKRYYYAIMPYHIALDDNDHPIKYYRWTKVFSVDTAKFLVAPTIFPITVIEGTEMTIAYSIPVLESGSYAVQKLVGKKGSIPTSKTDGTVLVDLTPTAGQIVNTVTVTGLDEESTYYFVIFIEDTDGNSASSEPQDATTGVDLGWNYDYTGAIQTFIAPKTGVYSLETWGAQGGDATDGTNTARGGYGAYAYGEVLLQQGETIYINVGGQNGYGGGGGYIPPQETIDENKCKSVSFANAYGVDVDYSGWVLDKLSVFASYDYLTTGYPLNCYNDGNTRDTITYNNGEVVFNGSNYNLSSIAYALSQTYDNVTAITFDLAIGSTASGYACGNVDLINISDQKTVSDSKRVMIAYSGTQRTDADFVATDGSYHTYTKEFSTPISGVNYIAFDKNAANISIKNVKLILG